MLHATSRNLVITVGNSMLIRKKGFSGLVWCLFSSRSSWSAHLEARQRKGCLCERHLLHKPAEWIPAFPLGPKLLWLVLPAPASNNHDNINDVEIDNDNDNDDDDDNDIDNINNTVQLMMSYVRANKVLLCAITCASLWLLP